MELKDGEHTYQVIPISEGGEYWLAIAKDGVQIGNPQVDANQIVGLIQQLKVCLQAMMDI